MHTFCLEFKYWTVLLGKYGDTITYHDSSSWVKVKVTVLLNKVALIIIYKNGLHYYYL